MTTTKTPTRRDVKAALLMLKEARGRCRSVIAGFDDGDYDNYDDRVISNEEKQLELACIAIYAATLLLERGGEHADTKSAIEDVRLEAGALDSEEGT